MLFGLPNTVVLRLITIQGLCGKTIMASSQSVCPLILPSWGFFSVHEILHRAQYLMSLPETAVGTGQQFARLLGHVRTHNLGVTRLVVTKLGVCVRGCTCMRVCTHVRVCPSNPASFARPEFTLPFTCSLVACNVCSDACR